MNQDNKKTFQGRKVLSLNPPVASTSTLLYNIKLIVSGFWCQPQGSLYGITSLQMVTSRCGALLNLLSSDLCPFNHLCLAGMCLSTVPWPTQGLNINTQGGCSTVKVALHHPEPSILNQVALMACVASVSMALWHTVSLEKSSSGAVWKRWVGVAARDCLYLGAGGSTEV